MQQTIETNPAPENPQTQNLGYRVKGDRHRSSHSF